MKHTNKETQIDTTEIYSLGRKKTESRDRIAFTSNLIIPRPEYVMCGKYKVKETFAGEATLTELLTEYIERKVTLKF